MPGTDPTSEAMGRAAGPGESLCFGTFELQLDSGELRREGVRVPLQPQPARVLQLLAERAGTVVARSRLQEALWGDANDVDADQGLNYCILQIRRALGDDAESPAFVETIPRRGYRFLQVVRRTRLQPRVHPPEISRRHLLAGAAGALALAALATWFVMAGQGALSDRRPRLTVEPLRGSSGSAAVADALTDELISDLVARYGDRVAVTTRVPSSGPGEGESPVGSSHHLMRGTVLPLGTGFRSTVWLEAMPSRRQMWTAACDLIDEPQDRARCARRLVDGLVGRLELTSSTAE